MNDDYSPIAEQGDIAPPASGLSALFRGGRRELPPVRPGFQMVLVDRNGTARPADRETAGERQWRGASTWILVDVGLHPLSFTVGVAGPAGVADFLVGVDVGCSVTDPVAVANLGITDVRPHLEPAVRKAVQAVAAHPDAGGGEERGGAVRSLADARARLQRVLDQRLEDALHTSAPTWLKAVVRSVAVGFEAGTEEHYQDLRSRTRNADLISVEADNDELRAKAQFRLMDLWRDALGARLADPINRRWEVFYADPTPERLASVTDAVDELDAPNQRLARSLMESAMSTGLIDDDPQLRKQVLSWLRGQVLGSPTGDGGAAELGGGERPRLDAAADEPATDADGSDS